MRKKDPYLEMFYSLFDDVHGPREEFESGDPTGFALHDAFVYCAHSGSPLPWWLWKGLEQKLLGEYSTKKGKKHVAYLRKKFKKGMHPLIRFDVFNWFLLQEYKEKEAMRLAALALEVTPGAIKHARDDYKKARRASTDVPPYLRRDTPRGKVKPPGGFEDVRPSEVAFGPDEDVLVFLLEFGDLPDDVLKRFVSACMKIPAGEGYRHDFLKDFRGLAPENHKLFLAAYEGRPLGTRYRFLSKFRTVPRENHRRFLLKTRAENRPK